MYGEEAFLYIAIISFAPTSSTCILSILVVVLSFVQKLPIQVDTSCEDSQFPLHTGTSLAPVPRSIESMDLVCSLFSQSHCAPKKIGFACFLDKDRNALSSKSLLASSSSFRRSQPFPTQQKTAKFNNISPAHTCITVARLSC